MTSTKRRSRVVFNYFIIIFCRIKKRVWIHDGVVRRFAPLLYVHVFTVLIVNLSVFSVFM